MSFCCFQYMFTEFSAWHSGMQHAELLKKCIFHFLRCYFAHISHVVKNVCIDMSPWIRFQLAF